jgi:mycothiol synthase
MPDEPLTPADLPDLQQLARACLDRDGGLPRLAEARLLRARLLREVTLAIREAGALVAAAGLTVEGAEATTSGMVTPAARGRGLGTRLLAWAEERAGHAPLTVVTESCGPDAERLYARRGMVRTFAESVLRHDLRDLPAVEQPDGFTVIPVADADERDLFTAYARSFADRRHFAAPSEAAWLGELREDDDWRRDLSVVVLAEDGTAAGFVNVLGRWVDQVGVLPAWRGHRLGAYLVARTLRALAAEDADAVWLCVNVDNPAGDLYRRLGFTDSGTRARYTVAGPTPA